MKCFTVILTAVVIYGASCCSASIVTVPCMIHIYPSVLLLFYSSVIHCSIAPDPRVSVLLDTFVKRIFFLEISKKRRSWH